MSTSETLATAGTRQATASDARHSPPRRGEGGVILLVVADRSLAQQLIAVLSCGSGAGPRCQLPIAVNLAQARARIRQVTPIAILLDESALELSDPSPGDLSRASPREDPLVCAVRELARPGGRGLVVVADPARQADLSALGELVSSGSVDLVFALGDYVSLAAALLQRHLWASLHSPGVEANPTEGKPADAAADFGEILRHEVNNPLTGILGNAELLLAGRDRLPDSAVHRLEVIAGLAVRLRETIHRLSNTFSAPAVLRRLP